MSIHSWGFLTLPKNQKKWQKWRNWVLGKLWLYITVKKTFGEAIKSLEALVDVIDMTFNAILLCQVTNWGRLVFPKTRYCLPSIAKMAKVGFGPT